MKPKKEKRKDKKETWEISKQETIWTKMEGKREKENKNSCIKCTLINNWFIRQRAFIEIWSTQEVWRARKMLTSQVLQLFNLIAQSIYNSWSFFKKIPSLETEMTYEPIVF